MEPNHGSTEKETDDERLTALTADLSASDATNRVKAAEQLGEMPTGNFESLIALERCAAEDRKKEVRLAALSALGSPTYDLLSRHRTHLAPGSRKLILSQIEVWINEGLLPAPLAEVLRQRYAPYAVKQAKKPRAPRATLSQVLLSETSIRIALSLGGFFVVVAAFIVAAVIESARLPILTLLTAGFFATGFGLKRRLPAASFYLYAIFTVLLVIDAWVLSQGAELNVEERQRFWTLVSLVMAAVWGVSTVLYKSRLFSVFAVAAATAAVILFSATGENAIHTVLFSVQVVSALGLVVVYRLIRWRGTDFAVPVFTLIQLQIAGTLLVSLRSVAMILADPDLPVIEPTTWALISATWLIGAVAYAVSFRMFRLQLFQYLAMLALMPVPQLLAGVWSPEARTTFTISWVWGAVLALAGEGIGIARWEDGRAYSPFLIGASVPLFAFAGVAWFLEDNLIGAAFLAGSALIYLGLMISRPRVWIWIGSLSFALAAYLAALFGPGSNVYPGFALLAASLVFLSGWVIAEKWLRTGTAWQIAPMALGFLTAIAAFSAFLPARSYELEKAALGFGILAAYLYGLGAIRGTPKLGFAASGSLAFSLLFTLIKYDVEVWVIPFVGLAAVFYLTGLLLRARDGLANWSKVLRYSGLALGGIIGIAAPLEGGDSAVLGVAVVASMFALEAALQRRVELGYPAIFYYLIAYIMVLIALDVTEPQAYSIGVALLGFVMHYLLVRAGNRRQAFVMGGLSQLVLLGTTYIQMLATEKFSFFFVLFLQSLAVLAYGVVVRSRSLILVPILFSILGVVSVAFSVLAGVNTAILIGCTGLLMIVLGVLALLYRDRLLTAGQRLGKNFGSWLD